MTWNFEPLTPFDSADWALVDAERAEMLAPKADFLVSLWGTPTLMESWRKPSWVKQHPAATVGLFDDVTRDHNGYVRATEAQIRSLLSLAPHLYGRVVVHCAAGISRSSAVTLGLLAARMGPGKEDKAVQALLLIRQKTEQRGWRDDGISPNPWIVELCDRVLDRHGDLTEMCNDMLWSCQ